MWVIPAGGSEPEETKMTHQTLTLDQLKGQPLEKVLQEVADRKSIVTVLLPDGREVVIESKPLLKPLPKLEGRVPEGWKDAIYGRG